MLPTFELCRSTLRPSERISLTSTLNDSGNTRLERVVAAHDRLVHLGAAGDVVRLHRQHFLQRVGRAVGLERPDLHFAETLAAELRLAAQRLLGDERVRTDRTRVDLVVDQMVQLEHVDVPNRHLAVEGIAGPPVIDGRLAGSVETGELQHLLDVGFLGAVEHRRRDRHAVAEITAKLDQFAVVERLDRLFVAVDLLQGLLQRLDVLLGVQIGIDRLADALAETSTGPAEMGFENLPDVHARGTPSGLSTMSAWVPSSRNGMSSIGTILETTPLLP